MIKNSISIAINWAFYSAIGILILSPSVGYLSNSYARSQIEKEQIKLDRSYNKDPIDSFIELQGVEADDITFGDTEQKLRTFALVHTEVKAKGLHSLFCLVDGKESQEEGGIVEKGENDYLLESLDFPVWSYLKQDGLRPKWPADIDPEKYKKCESRKIYWSIPVEIIMPNGTIRQPVEVLSNVAEIK